MSKLALAFWPKRWREEESPASPNLEPDRWVQEEEVLKLQLQRPMAENPSERLRELLHGQDLKRLVL